MRVMGLDGWGGVFRRWVEGALVLADGAWGNQHVGRGHVVVKGGGVGGWGSMRQLCTGEDG
jgi:hypothetical protein